MSEKSPCIAKGLGRSYGDSSVSKSKILITTPHNKLLNFDPESGQLEAQSGISFAELLDIFVPKGFFPPVVPGTKYITLGGAVASNIHGKNHHQKGSFCDHVTELKMIDPIEGLLVCSPKTNPEIFHSTCAGMGLTGIIDTVTFRLKKIKSSEIKVTEKRASSLTACMDLFEKYKDEDYSVAWIDCLTGGKNKGRSVFMVGKENAPSEKKPTTRQGSRWTVPFFFPSFFLNPISVKIFNSLYYHKRNLSKESFLTHYDPYFFPLDSISHWNRIYGRNGFMQYQFVVPPENAFGAMDQVLQKVSDTGTASFLSVIKKFGPQTGSYLDFPMEGYTLAMDFKYSPGNLDLLNQLDKIVLKFNGRVYLTKDARLSRQSFDKMYGVEAQRFRKLRKQMKWDRFFSSEQSKRLEL